MSVAKLVTQLRPRVGRFIPREAHPEWLPKEWSFSHSGMRAEVVSREDTKGREEVKDYMRRIFYREAPIPKVLGLSEGPRPVRDFLEEEMDIHLDYGGTLTVKKEDDSLVGMSTFAIWEQNDGYQVLEGDCRSWHDAAATLAEERAAEVDPRITWRDFQFQHIYNLCQRSLRRHPDRRGMVWATHLSFLKEAREKGLSEAMIANCARVTSASGLLLGTQISFPGFAPFVLRNFTNPFLVAESKYADEQLEVGGEKVLRSLGKLDSMQYYVNLPR